MAERLTELTLPYLGERTYLHGTTLFDALAALVSPKADVNYSFARMVRSDRVEVVAAGDIAEVRGMAHVTLTYRDEAGRRALGVKPLPPSPEPRRVPYDESLVTGRATFGDGRAEFDGPSPFSFVATVVPLHKALLARSAPHAGPGQWLFTRLDLDRLPTRASPLRLDLQGVLPGGMMARSRVSVAGSPAGVIYFSWSTPA